MSKPLVFLFLIIGLKSHAQNTYPFPSSGYVGIGTNNPVSQLNVSGTFVVTGANLDRNGSDANLNYLLGSGKCLIGWNRSAGKGETNFISSQGPGSSGGFSFIHYKYDGSENELVYMNGNGNVGIGTGNPNEKLSVNGKIRAHEVKVETANWPDYVFEQDYKVLGLTELDAYIKQHKHLPEMPSAKEVEANGVELGELVKLQQKKIEELTLYLIELKKESADQKKRISEIEKKK